MLTAFKKYLLSLKLSPVSRKLYLSDISRFLSWLGKEPSLDQLMKSESYANYLTVLTTKATAPSMLKRTIASLKQFGSFLSLTYSLQNPMLNLSLSQKIPTNDYIKHFTNYLNAEQLSPLTIKSYKSDISRYLDWASTNLASTQISEVLTDKNIKNYLNYLSQSGSSLPSTIERKAKSITRFNAWYTTSYPHLSITDNINVQINKDKPLISRPRPTDYQIKSHSSSKEENYSPEDNQNLVKTSNSRKQHFSLVPNFASASLSNFLTLLILLVFVSTLAIFGYRQFSRDVGMTAAYPSAAVTPSRQLSFQGRLEDATGTPITTATNLTFKLFNAVTGPTELYSTGACSITPDTDGVFSTQIGGTCGSAIPSSVFTENASVWLEVTVGTGPGEILDPRQPIASVAYALNSETIQGFPLSSTISAIRNTIVPMNQWGEIIVGEQSPRLTGVSGTFQISAPSLSFVTASGTNGNITFAPDGDGVVNVTGSSTTTTNLLNVIANQLTSGSLFNGTSTSTAFTGTLGNLSLTGNNAANTGTIFKASSTGALNTGTVAMVTNLGAGTSFRVNDETGDTDSTPFLINASGSVGIGTTNPLFLLDVAGTTSVNSLNINDAYTLPTVDGSLNYVLKTNGSGTVSWAAQTAGGGDSYWRLTSGASNTSLSTINDTLDVLIGGVATSSAKIGFINIDSGTPTINLANQASNLAIKDNTSSALKIIEGANTYLDVTTTDNAESFSLSLPAGGATSHTANLFTTNIAQTLNLGTGTAVDTINIGTGGTSADDINLGGLSTSHTDVTGIINFAGGTTYYVDANGNAKFLDLQVADSGNPGITVGSSSNGQIKIGDSTITDDNSIFTLDSSTGLLSIPDDASISGTLTLGNGTTNTLRSAYGALTLDAKTGLDTWTAALTVDDLTANIGIGTTTPTSKLDIHLDDAVASDISNVLTLSHTTSDAGNGVGGSSDTYTKALLHMDAADGTTTFSDDTGKTWTTNGNAQTDTAQSKFGGSSGLFDGTGDNITGNGSSDFTMGSNDFTIDFWVRFNSGIAATTLYDGRPTAGTNGFYPNIGVNASSQIRYLVNSSTVITGTTTLATGNWYHVALTRSGTSTRLFINGTQEGSTWSDSSSYAGGGTNTPTIGTTAAGANGLNGWLDEVRVSNGIARWTSTFTPDSTPYTYNTNTGIGTGILFNSEDNAGTATNAARISASLVDSTSTSVDSSIVFETREAGGALARAMRIWQNGAVTIGGWLSQDSNPDIAENILVTDPTIQAGDVVMVDSNYTPNETSDIYNRTAVTKANTPYSPQILGVISTDPGIILNAPESGIDTKNRSLENERPIALTGRIPVNIDPDSEPFTPGDMLTASEKPGLAKKATEAGYVLGKALEAWPPVNGNNTQALIFVQPGFYEPNLLIKKIGDSLTTLYSKIIAKLGVFDELQVATISPLSGSTITVNGPVVLTNQNPISDPSEPLLVVDGELEASTISARTAILKEVHADLITANNIVADTIEANHIIGLDAKLATLSSELSESEVETITSRIKDRLSLLTSTLPTAADIPTPQIDSPPIELSLDPSASSSAQISTSDLDFVTINNYLAVIGQATITTLDVTGDFYTNTLSSKNDYLAIQPTGIINLGSNTLLVDSTGQVKINGDLSVSGKILADSASLNTLILGNSSTSSELGKLLSIYNEAGEPVATIDASGSANLASLTTNMVTIASAATATESAGLSEIIGKTKSNATVGESTITTPNTELVIESPFITSNSLVYLTPTGNTENKVLFIKSKQTCSTSEPSCIPSFTVGIDQSASTDIPFNWWIIQLK